ncbi:TonB-dependent receptor [Ideonella paludis]|uniref:TonB-dependent receptor n=1 Tax=Ideonella paludis TaxID=1233411 RepID=UPI00362E1498
MSSTLVLLNGRRLANFASPGDSVGVDLNNIPAAAIQRVEILLDGASALYGSDAIGGVINFITRRDYQGVEVNALVGNTQEGGAGKRSASVAGGWGDFSKDGFNVFGVLDVQSTSRLDTSQRKFISDLKIPERLPHLLSGVPFPANLRLSSAQAARISERGTLLVNGKPYFFDDDKFSNRTINLQLKNDVCNPPSSLYLPTGIGGDLACTYDYMRELELYPETKKASLFGRGVLDIGGGHQLFAEAALMRSNSYYVGTPNRQDFEVDYRKIPGLENTGLDTLGNGGEFVTVRARLSEAGKRTSELVSTGQRLVLGASGTLASWDYEVGVNHSVNKVSDRDHNGYLIEQKVLDGIDNGSINLFGPSSAAGLAVYEASQFRGEVRRATGTMTSLDVKGSRDLMKLSGGNLALAVGAELRRESQEYHQSPELAADSILGESSQGPDADFRRSRNVSAVWSELSAPLSKELELQLAARHERYQVTGSATSPKLGLRYVPSKEVLLRASVGAGFRAPSMTDLYRPLATGEAATIADPKCLETGGTLTDCADGWETRTYSNPQLKPEKSKQFSLGAVFEPNEQFSLSVDYWNIEKRDLISTLGVDVILGNLAKYESLVHRYGEDEGLCDYYEDDIDICFIELNKQNRGREKASGLDIGLNLRGLKTSIGTFGARLNGTLALSSKRQTGNGDPYISNLGKFVNDGVVQRWRHTISLDWESGDWGATLSNSYLSGYEDQNNAIDTNTGSIVDNNRVKAYSLWNLSGSWEASKGLVLRAGVQNLLNTAPPFSNQAYHFISGYDPSYTDPRGRYFYLSAQYRFK